MGKVQLEEAWRSERSSLVRAVYLVCGDLDRSAEIVDQTFLTVFARVRSSPVENVRAYLWRAAFNGAHRATKRERQVQAATDLAGRTALTQVPGPGDIDPHDDLVASLARLNTQTRSALVLRYYGDFTNAQVAEQLSLPIGTVKSLIHRGLASLRSDLMSAEECEL